MAVFSLTLKQSIIVQGVIFRLCVIQFTRYSALTALAVSLLSIPRLQAFVKNFFRSFSNSFACAFPSQPPLSEQLAYITTCVSVCQAVFGFISDFFHLAGGASDPASFPSSGVS